MTETELLPCPFCGGAPHMYEHWSANFNWFSITCTECGISVQAPSIAPKWNRRADPSTRASVSEAAITEAAANIVDVMMGGDKSWRDRLNESTFLESADWHMATIYAQAALASTAETPARRETWEEALECQPSTAENPNESAYQRGRFDGIMEYSRAIRARATEERDDG